MSVLIMGMDMPKKPEQCKLRKVDEESGDIFESAWCVISKHYCGYAFPRDCPLVEVPTPHGDLVDFDQLQPKWVEDVYGMHQEWFAPTVIESED